MLSALRAYACRSLGPLACVVAFVPLVTCLDVTICEICPRDVGLLGAYCSSLYAMLCLPCSFVPPVWLSLFLCIFAHLPICSCISPYVFVSSSLVPMTSCRFTPVFDTRDHESLLGTLLDGTCVIHTPI